MLVHVVDALAAAHDGDVTHDCLRCVTPQRRHFNVSRIAAKEKARDRSRAFRIPDR